MSDSFQFDITGVGLELALPVAMSQHRVVTGWLIDTRPEHRDRLVLFWTPRHGGPYNKFPSNMTMEGIGPVIEAWLGEVEYGPEPDIDGSCEKGFRIYNEAWGKVGGMWEAFAAIEPVWLMYGK